MHISGLDSRNRADGVDLIELIEQRLDIGLGEISASRSQERDCPIEGRLDGLVESGQKPAARQREPKTAGFTARQRRRRLPGEDRIPPPYISDNVPYHMKNWFECLRSRKQPNATVRNGYSHAVAVIMAARAYREGKKLWWDGAGERIVDSAVG